MQTLFNHNSLQILEPLKKRIRTLLQNLGILAKPPSKKIKTVILTTYFLVWFAYFFYFWSNSFIINNTGGISAQHVNLWGDWAAHFTMGSAMAERELILTTSPFLLGASFSYPFVADMLSAILIRMNVEFFMAFVLPSFVFSCMLIIALFLFYKQISKSIVVALLASSLFLFNGGTGFVYYLQDIATSTDKIHTAINPPQDYTNIEHEHYRWISVITSMVFPQRAFTLGFPLALIILTVLTQTIAKPEKQSKLLSLLQRFTKKKSEETHKKTLLFGAAALTGLLPIIHTHSFLALFVILAFWSIGDVLAAKTSSQRKSKLVTWATFAAVVGVIAIPLIAIFIAGTVQHSFIKWYPGWYVGNDYPDETLLSFWFKNWSIVPILSVLGFTIFIEKSKKKLHDFFLFAPFFVLFILTNLVLFQPFVWDNTKILVWASLGFSLLTAQLLYWLWKEHTWLKPVVVLLTIFLCFSGFLDAYRAIRFPLHSYQMYSKEEAFLVEWTKKNTPSDSIWLTGTYHNHWLFNRTGRQALATYTGWLWTHGYNYYAQEQAIRHMYSQPQISPYFETYGIEYVVVGPFERREYGADVSAFPTNFITILESDTYTILQRRTQ